MRVGDRLPTFRTTASAESMKDMSGLLRDPNPIHLDREAARKIGFDGRVNQGPANLAYVINMLEAAFPEHRLKHLASRYLGVVMEDDVVEAGGILRSSERDEISCDVWLHLEDGRSVIEGSAQLVRR